MDIKKFIELSAEGDAAKATDYLNDVLSAKAFDALGERKQELARTIFGGRAEPIEDEEVTEEPEEVVEEEVELEEGDAYDYDRYKVQGGKATLHNPAKGEKDEPHHVWAESPAHALEKFKKKSGK